MEIKFPYRLKTGSIILFHKKGILPYLIRKIAKTDYNHAGVILHFNNRNFVAEALKEGTRIIPLEKRLNDHNYSKKVRIYQPVYPAFDLEKFWFELFDIVGRNYDLWNTFVVQLFYNLFNIWIGPKKEQKALKTLNCYEVIWYLHRNTKTFTQHYGKWWMSKLYDIIENKFAEFELVYEIHNYKPKFLADKLKN